MQQWAIDQNSEGWDRYKVYAGHLARTSPDLTVHTIERPLVASDPRQEDATERLSREARQIVRLLKRSRSYEFIGSENLPRWVFHVPTCKVEPAIERIAEMAKLPVNWDGEGAEPITGAAAAAACRLIVAVAERIVQGYHRNGAPWTSAPIADGGVQVEWLGNNVLLEVQVGPGGEYGYLLKLGTGDEATYREQEGVEFDAILDLISRTIV